MRLFYPPFFLSPNARLAEKFSCASATPSAEDGEGEPADEAACNSCLNIFYILCVIYT